MVAPSLVVQQVGAALFYAISSLLVVFINKIVLSTFSFPSFNFLALCQFLTTSLIIGILSMFKKIQVENLTKNTVRAMIPLTTLFFLNVIFGLGGTQRVSLPMFTVLRRFSIFITMAMEQYFGLSKSSKAVEAGVMLMIIGALIAALSDLSFDLQGYMMIFANDIFTASYGISMKKALTGKSVSKTALLFYNSLFSSIIMVFLISSPYVNEVNEIISFPLWADRNFVVLFFLASIMGSVLNYSIFLCTAVNSALTTTVVGCLKNVLTAYIGMFLGGGYIFNVLNFIGLNVSIGGSIFYSWAKFRESKEKSSTAASTLLEKSRKPDDLPNSPQRDAKDYV